RVARPVTCRNRSRVSESGLGAISPGGGSDACGCAPRGEPVPGCSPAAGWQADLRCLPGGPECWYPCRRDARRAVRDRLRRLTGRLESPLRPPNVLFCPLCSIVAGVRPCQVLLRSSAHPAASGVLPCLSCSDPACTSDI